MSCCLQFRQDLAVQSEAFALDVWCTWPAAIWSLAPLNPKPGQVLDGCAGELLFAALWVKVLNAKNELPTGLACVLAGDPKCLCVSKVEQAGRCRGDASAIRLHAVCEVTGQARVKCSHRVRGACRRYSRSLGLCGIRDSPA